MKILNRRKGFTLLEVMIVAAVISLLAIIAVPNFIQARDRARSGSCINSLRTIDSAKEQYALESNIATGTATTPSSIRTCEKINPHVIPAIF